MIKIDNTDMRERVEEYLRQNEVDAWFLDDMDDAIVGVVEAGDKFKVVYSYDACIEILMRDMDYESAVEYFDYNTRRAIPYYNQEGMAPLILGAIPE